MKNTKSKIIVAMCAVLGIMAIGYAFFVTNLSITATGNIGSNWNVKFISITEGNNGGTEATNAALPTYSDTTATMSATLNKPGDYMEYELVLKNAGNIPAIIEEINAEATGTAAIIFSINGIKEGDKLATNDTKTITVKIEYDPYVVNQPTESTKTLTVSIKAVQDTGQNIEEQNPTINQGQFLTSAILRDNIAYADNVRSEFVDSDTGIDFSDKSSNTNGKGLYYTSKNTENNKTTYYFRGDVDNNYVKFGSKAGCGYKRQGILHVTEINDMNNIKYTLVPTEEQCLSTTICDAGTILNDYYKLDYYRYVTGIDVETCSYLGGTPLNDKATYGDDMIDLMWRIVRINEDESIRIVTQDIVGNSAFNPYPESPISVGYMYGNVEELKNEMNEEKLFENVTDSTIKTYLDSWYVNNLSSYSNYIADAGFCNDRKHDGYFTFDARYRVEELNFPQFMCTQNSDLFTLIASKKGNKTLTYPIGLLTMDEVIYAGGEIIFDNWNYYLNNGDNCSHYWTMTPYDFFYDEEYSDYGSVVIILEDGGIAISDGMFFDVTSDIESGVRPVINLRSTVEITKGTGTSDNPYIIKTN